METLAYVAENLPAIGAHTLEHLPIVGVAKMVAIGAGMEFGVLIARRPRVVPAMLSAGALAMKNWRYDGATRSSPTAGRAQAEQARQLYVTAGNGDSLS